MTPPSSEPRRNHHRVKAMRAACGPDGWLRDPGKQAEMVLTFYQYDMITCARVERDGTQTLRATTNGRAWLGDVA